MSDWLDTNVPAERLEALLADVRGGRLTSYAAHGERFGAWMFLVDRWLWQRYGLTHADLADYRWRDDFQAGTDPREAAREALSADDLFALVAGREG